MRPKPYLLAFDFDGTFFNTFSPSKNGINVQVSTQQAIYEVFGPPGELAYQEIGGFQNRAPSELVTLMLDTHWGNDMLWHAHHFCKKEAHVLKSLVPEGKGVPLILEQPLSVRVAIEVLVRAKLRISSQEITGETQETRWPQPCHGLCEFWQQLYDLKKDTNVSISTAVISSGHENFILKTFKMWGLQKPDFLITEDDIRGKKHPATLERRVKPGTWPLAYAHQQWMLQLLRSEGITAQELQLAQEIIDVKDDAFRRFHEVVAAAKQTRMEMMYFGDDPKKDGGLAERGGIPFGLYQASNREFAASTAAITFSDWQVVAQLLKENISVFREGRPISYLFAAQSGLETNGRYTGSSKES